MKNNMGGSPLMKKDEKSIGAMTGIVVVIAILLMGGWYLWKETTREEVSEETMQVEEVENEQNSELDNFEKELDTLEQEI